MLTMTKSFVFLSCLQGCMAEGVMPVYLRALHMVGSLSKPELLCNMPFKPVIDFALNF